MVTSLIVTTGIRAWIPWIWSLFWIQELLTHDIDQAGKGKDLDVHARAVSHHFKMASKKYSALILKRYQFHSIRFLFLKVPFNGCHHILKLQAVSQHSSGSEFDLQFWFVVFLHNVWFWLLALTTIMRIDLRDRDSSKLERASKLIFFHCSSFRDQDSDRWGSSWLHGAWSHNIPRGGAWRSSGEWSTTVGNLLFGSVSKASYSSKSSEELDIKKRIFQDPKFLLCLLFVFFSCLWLSFFLHSRCFLFVL